MDQFSKLLLLHKQEAAEVARNAKNVCDIPGWYIAWYVRDFNPEANPSTREYKAVVNATMDFIHAFFTAAEEAEEYQEFEGQSAGLLEMFGLEPAENQVPSTEEIEERRKSGLYRLAAAIRKNEIYCFVESAGRDYIEKIVTSVAFLTRHLGHPAEARISVQTGVHFYAKLEDIVTAWNESHPGETPIIAPPTSEI